MKRFGEQVKKRNSARTTLPKGSAMPYELDLIRRYWPEEGPAMTVRISRSEKWIRDQAKALGVVFSDCQRRPPVQDDPVAVRRMDAFLRKRAA